MENDGIVDTGLPIQLLSTSGPTASTGCFVAKTTGKPRMFDVLVAHEHQFRSVQTYRLHLQPHFSLTRLLWRLPFNPQNLGSSGFTKTKHF
jgi:hypothetical protein